jgi:hypothetical protein
MTAQAETPELPPQHPHVLIAPELVKKWSEESAARLRRSSVPF